MCKKSKKLIISLMAVLIVLSTAHHSPHKTNQGSNFKYARHRTNAPKPTKTMCTDIANILRARKKVCFLRPDTGPCRADIIQWYYDVKQKKCYRFFWGGCQGNGNKFESHKKCLDYCYLHDSNPPAETPQYCSLAFDYGSCYGHYYRWGWDKLTQTCRRRLYSGCGGNQNNFETKRECMHTCLLPPSNTLIRNYKQHQTTCVPLDIENLL